MTLTELLTLQTRHDVYAQVKDDIEMPEDDKAAFYVGTEALVAGLLSGEITMTIEQIQSFQHGVDALASALRAVIVAT